MKTKQVSSDRGSTFTRKLMKVVRKILPRIKETERQALQTGDLFNDADFFAGKPNFSGLLSQMYGGLTEDEQAFIDGPCEKLCRMFDRWEVYKTHRVPDEVMAFLKEEGFFGLRLPKELQLSNGRTIHILGKGFSFLAISTVLHKLGPYSAAVATIATIANSLGAGELIEAYGTDEQKETILRKLASGELIPCFGLTELTAGSDAASIKAEGVLFKHIDGQIKIRLQFRKRYITLAPIANLATIACKLKDPDHLLDRKDEKGRLVEDIGITCVLVYKGTPGFESGKHHRPLGDSFENGPLVGNNVVVPINNIIGGPAFAGHGWQMLMEQLAGGRAGSLPAGALGIMKLTMASAAAYSMVREQFNRPIGYMEGIAKKVGFIATLTYMFEAARVHTCTAVMNGVHPPVTSAVLKAYSTEWGQKLVKEGMDIFAGAAVQEGPNNILAPAHMSSQVGVVVEGANPMNFTMLIFGQGATRCHPYALNLLKAIENGDIKAFWPNVLGWLGHFLKGIIRTSGLSLTRGLAASVPKVAPATRTYYRRLAWAGAHFGMLSDLAMFTMSGKLKVRGMLSNRYADALAWMLIGESTLLRFEKEGRRQEDLPLVHAGLKFALNKVQLAFEGIYENFDVPVLETLMRNFGAHVVRMNRLCTPPLDREWLAAARTVQSYNDQYRRLTTGVFFPAEDAPGLGRLIKAFRLVTETMEAKKRIIKAQRDMRLPGGGHSAEDVKERCSFAQKLMMEDRHAAEVTDAAVQAKVISLEEAELLKEMRAAQLAAYEVDEFDPEDYYQD